MDTSIDDALFRLVVDQLPHFAVLIDRERHILWWNRLHENLDAEDLRAEKADRLVHPDDLELVIANLEQAFATGEPRYYEARGYDGSGNGAWYGVRIIPLNDANPPKHALLLTVDLSDRYRVVEELRRSEERFRRLVEALPDAMCIIDEERRIIYANSAIPSPSLVGQRLDDRIEPADRERAIATIVEVFASGQPGSYEAGGVYSQRRFVVRVTPLHSSGGPAQAVLVATDVTEQRRAEAARAALERRLAEAQRLELIGRMAGGVAHDFNNLLMVLRAHLGMALDAMRDGEDPTADLETMTVALDRAHDLTRELLSVGRRQPIVRQPVDLHALCERVVRMLRPTISNAIELHLQLDCPQSTAPVDAGEIERALTNLCLNARDAIGDGPGRIDITLREQRFEPGDAMLPADHAPGTYLEIAVHDDGPGIDDATLACIFEPFFTTKAPGLGTGLGLATAQGIAHQHAGFLSVKSALRQGSTFALMLPLDVAPVPAVAEAKPRRPTILVVGEDPGVRTLLVHILGASGYGAVEAGDEAEARRQLQHASEPIAAAVLDVLASPVVADRTHRALQGLRPGLPTIFITGYATQPEPSRVRTSPHVRVLGRPYRAEELLASVEALLSQTRIAG